MQSAVKYLGLTLLVLIAVSLLVGSTRDGQAVLAISGIDSAKSAYVVEKALRSAEGVKSVKLDWLSGQAHITYDRSKIDSERLVEAVNMAGDGHRFKATLSGNERLGKERPLGCCPF